MATRFAFRMDGGYTMDSGTLWAGANFGTAPLLGTPTFTDGTGANQVSFVYRRDFSINAGANLDIDLKGATGEKDVQNVALNLSMVRAVYIEFGSPAAGVSLRFGPQNVGNAWPGWWNGTGVTVYETLHGRFYKDNPFDGWAVGAATKVMRLNNPTVSTIAGTLLVAGY